MKQKQIYISSSWKNRERVREMAIHLRGMGFGVYDFTDPTCRKVPEIPPEKFPEQFDPSLHVYGEYIQRDEWKFAMEENHNAVLNSDLVVLLLPCGNDSHADWALGVGAGIPSVVVGNPGKGERSPVHLWADAILLNEDALYSWLRLPIDDRFYRNKGRVQVLPNFQDGRLYHIEVVESGSYSDGKRRNEQWVSSKPVNMFDSCGVYCGHGLAQMYFPFDEEGETWYASQDAATVKLQQLIAEEDKRGNATKS